MINFSMLVSYHIFALDFVCENVYYLWTSYPHILFMSVLSSVWEDFLKNLHTTAPKGSMLPSLLRQLKPVDLNERTITLGCTSQALRQFLEKKNDEIERLFETYSHKKLKVNLVTLEAKKKRVEQATAPLLSFQPTLNDIYLRAGLHIKYKFDNFAVSSSNQVAFAAAQAVSENLGTAYNPLFLHGGVGVGKTHLAQAVGKHILEKDQNKKVFFCPGDQFTNELIESIREKSTPKFRKKYRYLNLLIIDDVQFIAGKQTVQEEFFHTFNSVISAGGQIILTSDRPPSEIQNLEDRLRSRFSGGLVVDVQEPDFELRSAILLIKAREKNIEIDIEAAKIIAERVADTRALEGTLLSIYAKIIGVKEQIDLETVDQYFSSQKETKASKVTPNEVIKAVCSRYNIKQSHLKGPVRTDRIALPRQIAMYILRHELGMKYDEVAYVLKRKDHTTVMHATNKISALLSTNPVFKDEIDMIIKSLNLST